MRARTIVAAALATLALAAFAAPAQAKSAAPGGHFPSGSVPARSAAAVPKSGWSAVPTPNPRAPNGQLLFGTCATASSCTAVGTYVKPSGAGATLAERSDGSGWRIQPTPNPPGAKVSSLAGVACTTPSACTAVGDSITGSGIARTLVERWDGRSWSIQSTPNPAGAPQAFLIAVACSSSSSCTAVGYAATSSGTQVSLAERWDGTRWQIQPTPNPPGAQFSMLSDVSCTAPSACTAVGQTDRGILAERWDGSNWRIQPVPNPPSGGGGLLGVACTSPSSCTAAGFSNSGTLVERWDGTGWQIQPTPNPLGAQVAVLSGIGCSSGSVCSAVGAYQTASGDFVTMAERWNGTEWSTQPTPNPAGALGDFLFAVACPSGSACTALGYAHGSGTPLTMAQRWNGTSWLLSSTPNPTGAAESTFGGIACPSRSTCFAAGSGANAALVERWNGTAWRIQPVPTLPGAALSGVSCTSPSACMAAGGSDSGVLAERWNGTRWSILPAPNPQGAAFSFLGSISCASPSFCMAGGAYAASAPDSPVKSLTERWNGKKWAVVPSPNPAGAAQTFFNGVSCTAPSACTATGEQHSASGIVHTVAERWDGASWTIQPTPNPAKVQFASLGGVACTGPSACVAVGGSDRGSLVEGWNGTAWHIQASPTPAGGGSLNGVACSAPAACTAVGFTFTSSGAMILAERWNGTAWQIQPTPLLPAAHDVSLPAVACPEPTACTAVSGYENDGPSSVTLAERWPGDTDARQPAARPAVPSRAGADCALPLLVTPRLEAALQQPPSLRPGSRTTIAAGPRATSPGSPSVVWCRVR